MYQTLANLVHTFELEENYLDVDKTQDGILAAAVFSVQSTCHTTLQATPGQLVFGHDMVINTPFIAEWEAIKQRKHQIIDKNNKMENSKRKEHVYRVWDQVLLKNKRARKYKHLFKGLYAITKIWENGAVTLCKGAVQNQVNIRWIKSYKV